MTEQERVEERRPSSRPGWKLLLAASVLGLGLADAVVLDLTKAYFSSGYMGFVLRDPKALAVFFALSAVLDLALISGLWLLLGALATPLRGSSFLRLVGVAALGIALPLCADLALHRLHRVLGDVLHLDILLDLAGGNVLNAAAEAASEVPSIGLLVLLAIAALAFLLLAARQLEQRSVALARWELPPARTLLAVFAGATALGMALLVWIDGRSDRIAFGLSWKPSGRGLIAVVQRATDVDRDGFGLLSRPPDSAPFDAAVFPFARDRAGNGIDENGLAGDLPVEFVPIAPARPALPASAARPPLLILFLESFRADLIGLRFEGKEVTPFLNRLAREGASARHAYVHTPMTWNSRAQLFQGRLAPTRGLPTLVDDLIARGYRVGWFSGQDDSFSRGDALLGFDRADRFYDARQDKDRRTSRSAQPVSLQVSWKTLLERVEAYLDGTEPDRPLFLYVNLVDSHFPYDHAELDDILGTGTFSRDEIRPENAARVWAAYLNSAANVDRGARLATEAFERFVGSRDYAILVTSDHGEAFYEDGQLGHGQRVDDIQTRVPLILWGIGGDWPEPLAFSDLRGLLLANLARPPNRQRKARFVPDPEREIFQYTGAIGRPKTLGLRSLSSAIVYDVSRDQIRPAGEGSGAGGRTEETAQKDFKRLIRNWESARNERADALHLLDATGTDEPEAR